MSKPIKKCNCEHERLYRAVIEEIRSTLDINKIKKTIVTEVGKSLDAYRCFMTILNRDNNTFEIVDEYSVYTSGADVKSTVGFAPEAKELEFLISSFKNLKKIVSIDIETFIRDNRLQNSGVEEYFKLYNVKADIAIPIVHLEELYGVLIVHYKEKKAKLNQDEIEFVDTVSKQAGVALHQNWLYRKLKHTAERETLLRNIIEIIRSSMDINQIKSNIVNEVGKALNANICFIMNYNKEGESFFVDKYSEYRSSEKEKSFIDFDFTNDDVKWFMDSFKSKNEIDYANIDEFLTANNLQSTSLAEFLNSYNLKSAYNFPIFYANKLFGYLVVKYTNDYKLFNESDLELLRNIAVQSGVALHQAELYRKLKQTADREALLRKITLKIRRSLNIKETLAYICEETAKVFNVQRSAIIFTDKKGNYNKSSLKAEYITASKIKGYADMVNFSGMANCWKEMFIERGHIITFDNLQKSEIPEELNFGYTAIGVKSVMGAFIKLKENYFGVLILSEYNKYRAWEDEEKDLFRTIADQIHLAINQASLYECQKSLVERERISRNIIEILRSSLDKKIIKKQFVKSIGDFFKADRVFFSDHNTKEKMYMPVEEGSEYLSNSGEKSFIGYDWSNPDIIEHMQILLEKREIKIPNWVEYTQQHPDMSEGFRKLYEDADVKSSYNFPVLHQTDIIGYFCIEFTQRVCELSDEDIGRIRSICTQAGIALYQANLYIEAQEAISLKNEFISKTVLSAKNILNNIVELSEDMSHTEEQCEKHVEYLNRINKNLKLFLDLTNNLTENIALS